MPGLIAGSRVSRIYNSDNTKSYNVSISKPKADAAGFGIGPPSGGQKPQTMKMRYIRGAKLGSGTADSAPATITLPIADASNPLFTGSTVTVTVNYPGGAIVYQVTGIFGERRTRLASE